MTDRLMIASALVGGLIVGVLPVWFGWGLIGREVLVAGLALYLAARGGGTIEVRWLGKAATFALYGAIRGLKAWRRRRHATRGPAPGTCGDSSVRQVKPPIRRIRSCMSPTWTTVAVGAVGAAGAWAECNGPPVY